MMKANCKIPLLGYRDSYPILHYDCPRLSLIDDHISLNSLASYCCMAIVCSDDIAKPDRLAISRMAHRCIRIENRNSPLDKTAPNHVYNIVQPTPKIHSVKYQGTLTMSESHEHIVIIGAGAAGLTAAIYLHAQI